MVRGIYSHELDDVDFVWLINNFKENNPDHYTVEIPGSPIVLLWVPVDQSDSVAVEQIETNNKVINSKAME
jgi:hypothetical protein